MLFTVLGQILMMWRVPVFGSLPEGFFDKARFFLTVLTDFYMLASMSCAFIASLFWFSAMTKMELTRAYPFMSLAPGWVFVVGVLFL